MPVDNSEATPVSKPVERVVPRPLATLPNRNNINNASSQPLVQPSVTNGTPKVGDAPKPVLPAKPLPVGSVAPLPQSSPVRPVAHSKIESPLLLSESVLQSSVYLGAKKWRESFAAESRYYKLSTDDYIAMLTKRAAWGQDASVRVAAFQLLAEMVGNSNLNLSTRAKRDIVNALMAEAKLSADPSGPLGYRYLYPIFVYELGVAMQSYCAQLEDGQSNCDKGGIGEVKEYNKILDEYRQSARKSES